ncbi:MAG: acsA 2 [Frankiales bacterium]|nr:acsA 2 [Frankiales bacterium]
MPEDELTVSRMAAFRDEVAARRGLDLPDYQALWSWTVDEPEAFWPDVVQHFGLTLSGDASCVLAEAGMPGAVWFPGASVSFAREVFRQAVPDRPALVALDETGAVMTTSWEQLLRSTQGLARWLESQGVRAGDRVVGYLGNRSEAVVAFLACASIGAIWAVCNQDVSAAGAAARFTQLEPKVLVTARSSHYGGRRIDHAEAIAELVAALPTAKGVLIVGGEHAVSTAPWDEAVATTGDERFVDVAFDHPLWVLFSSGTTGAPKGLVHGHGGVLLQQCVGIGLHFDVRPGDRLLWYCSTSWVMWNFQVASLLVGATAVLYDGSPNHPDVDLLWRIAEEHRITQLGVSPGLLSLMEKEGLTPAEQHDLSALRALGVTGSPLSAQLARWARWQVGVPLNVISGGTDVATAFVAANPLDPEPAPGRMGAPCLGVAAVAVDPSGAPLAGEVGELVITRPMPSMPVELWGDPDGDRYRETYFSTFPGVWRQGDWATFTTQPDGHVTVQVHGRSDATLNRNGVRLGTSEIYAAAERLPEVLETLVVGVEQPDGGYWLPMFVHLADGCALDEELVARLRSAIRTAASPRHVPDELIAVPGLPHTLTGKRLEVPVKRLLLGHPTAEVVSVSAVDRPELLAWFADFAAARGATGA